MFDNHKNLFCHAAIVRN